MSRAEAGRLATPGSSVRAVAAWIAGHDLLIVALAAPFLLFPDRWTPLACAALALPWLGRRIAAGAFSIHTPADAPLALLIVMSATGLAASVDARVSLELFWRLVLGLAVFYGLANGVRSSRDRRWLNLALAAAGLGLLALTLLGTRWQAVRLADLPQLYGRLPALLRDPQDSQSFNPRVMGMALAILLPMLVSVTLFAKDRPCRVAAGAAAVLMALVLPLTQALQGLLAAGAGLAFLALWRSRWFLLGLLPAAGLAGWALAHYDLRGLALALLAPGEVAGAGVALRLDMWARALAMLRDMPFSGIGLNTFPQIQTHFYPGFLIGPEPHAHNLFLQIGLDLGLPGLVAFLWLLVAAGWMAAGVCRRDADRDERALAIGALAGIIAYLGAGIIDSPWTPKPGILLWLLLGTLAAVYGRVAGRETTPAPGRGQRWLSGPAPLLAAAGLLGLLLVAAPGLRERNLGALQAHQALYGARLRGQVAAGALVAPEDHLQRAADLGLGNAQVYSSLGSLYAWGENDAAALAALARQVELDSLSPMAGYAPFEALRRAISGEPGPGAAADLLQVYAQWQARFPDRAEPYVSTSLAQSRLQGRPDLAAAALEAALARGAQPRGLIEQAQAGLQEDR